jgi:hypothetical protein
VAPGFCWLAVGWNVEPPKSDAPGCWAVDAPKSDEVPEAGADPAWAGAESDAPKLNAIVACNEMRKRLKSVRRVSYQK